MLNHVDVSEHAIRCQIVILAYCILWSKYRHGRISELSSSQKNAEIQQRRFKNMCLFGTEHLTSKQDRLQLCLVRINRWQTNWRLRCKTKTQFWCLFLNQIISDYVNSRWNYLFFFDTCLLLFQFNFFVIELF